jgi:hypothetical protein
MVQGPLTTVIGCVYSAKRPTESSNRMFLSMITNVCAAIRELGTLGLRSAWCRSRPCRPAPRRSRGPGVTAC